MKTKEVESQIFVRGKLIWVWGQAFWDELGTTGAGCWKIEDLGLSGDLPDEITDEEYGQAYDELAKVAGGEA